MIRKLVSDLKGNEILARPLMTWDYQVILPEGSLLKTEYIDKITELGIIEVYVQDQRSNDIAILKSEVKNSIKERVQGILERFTYQYNDKELVQISETADKIISTILDEEQVVEKLFEIKERSTDLYEHSVNVCSTSTITAMRLKVDEDLIHQMGVGCLLHDIGFRYMDDRIPKKKVEELLPQERIEYMKHPVYGYSSFKDQGWISNISKNVVLYHHEKMNGTGFPLKTTEIPFLCRIVNVCDTFDEMICGIGYERKEIFEAVQYLKERKGMEYDEKIVDVFLSCIAVFPSGTIVELSSGEVAEVIGQNTDSPEKPIIRLLSKEQEIISLIDRNDLEIVGVRK